MKKEIKIDGVKVITNMLSLGIIINRYGDAAKVVKISDKIISKKPRWQEIKYNINGDPYITHYGVKHYLYEFMKYSDTLTFSTTK